MILISGLLILAWRNAGWYGLDRWVLPALGTPWHRGDLLDRYETAGASGGHQA
jgi:thiosulfate dehydrogenase [quinone] large subunit